MKLHPGVINGNSLRNFLSLLFSRSTIEIALTVGARSFQKNTRSLPVSTTCAYDVDIGSCYETAVVFHSKKKVSPVLLKYTLPRSYFLSDKLYFIDQKNFSFHVEKLFALFHGMSKLQVVEGNDTCY